MIQKFYDIMPVDRKFSSESVWNLAGLLVSGISGLALQVYVAGKYDPSVLGILNLTIVIITIYSQISGFGIHFSVLKHVPEHADNDDELSDIMVSSFLLTFFISLFFSLLFFLMIFAAEDFFKNKELLNSLSKIIPVFVLFPLNKIILAYLNGLRKMKIYAVYNSSRYVLWFISLYFISVYSANPSYLPFIFPVSESILFLTLIPFSIGNFSFLRFVNLNSWNKLNFKHGYSSVLGTIFADLGTRADILILGAFTSNYYVGIYSLASVIMDGFNQLSVTFRTLVNPVLTKSFYTDENKIFVQKIKRGKMLYYKLMIPLVFSASVIFPVTIKFLNLYQDYQLAYLPFLIMLAGFLLTSGYHPFQMIFNQTGHPGEQTAYFGLTLLTNVVLNIILIPFLGLYGAATASSLTLLMIPFYLNYLSGKSLGFRF